MKDNDLVRGLYMKDNDSARGHITFAKYVKFIVT